MKKDVYFSKKQNRIAESLRYKRNNHVVDLTPEKVYKAEAKHERISRRRNLSNDRRYSFNKGLGVLSVIIAFLVLIALLPFTQLSRYGVYRYEPLTSDSDSPVAVYYTFNSFDSMVGMYKDGFSILKMLSSPFVAAYNAFFGTYFCFIPLYSERASGGSGDIDDDYSSYIYSGREYVIIQSRSFPIDKTFEIVASSNPLFRAVERDSLFNDVIQVYTDDGIVNYYYDTETPNGEDWIQYSVSFQELYRLGIIWVADGNI